MRQLGWVVLIGLLVSGTAWGDEPKPQRKPRYRLAWGTLVGGPGWEQAREAIVCKDGSVLVGLQAASPDLPTTPGAAQPKYAGDDHRLGHPGQHGGDLYLVRLSADGKRRIAATYFGGSKQERNVYGMALDREDNVVVTTSTRSADVPTTEGAFQRKFGGGVIDMFAAKLSGDLKRVIWCTYVGGTGGDTPRGGLALDASDNVVLVGSSSSPTFPTTAGAYRREPIGGGDAVVVKLAADGSRVLWGTRLGTEKSEVIVGAVVGADGRVHLGGYSRSPKFPTTAGAPQPASRGNAECFIATLSADGAKLLSSTFIGGSGNEFAEHRIGRTRDGSLLFTGATSSTDFPTTPGTVEATPGKGGFVVRLAPDGKTFTFATTLGGGGGGVWLMPTEDAQGNIHMVGTTSNKAFGVTADAVQKTYGGGKSDGVYVVLSGDGKRLLYATYLGGTGQDFIRSVALGPDGAVYLVGSTTSGAFPAARGGLQAEYRGGNDAFIVKLEPGVAKR